MTLLPHRRLNPRAAQALTTVIKNSKAQTMMGVSKDLEEAAAALHRYAACRVLLRGRRRRAS